MKKSNVLLLAVAALGLGFTAVTTAATETAHAAYYYWTKTKNYSPSVAMKQKNPGTTAYMWNAHHTAKLHNLKNYPRTTWYLSKSVKMTRGSKSAIYYRVTSGSGKVNGYVWRGYLTQGVNTNTSTGTSGSTGSTGNVNTGSITWGGPVTAVESAQNKTILNLFPGTVQNATLMTAAHGLANLDDEEPDQAAADRTQILSALTSDQRSKVKEIRLNGDLSKISELNSCKLSYSSYIAQTLSDNKINPANYSGWSIGVGSVPKGADTAFIGYPNATILLVPAN